MSRCLVLSQSLKRFLATQQYAVNTGPDMRQVVLLALSNSTPDNGSSSSCGLAMDSGNRIVSCIEIEDIQYWAQASQDFLPILDDLIGDEEAAIATCAWMYELYNRIGWDLCMVL